MMLAIPLLLSLPVSAQQAKPVPTGTLIEQSVSRPIDGLGGWSEVKHNFSKGDRVHLHFDANKQLERVLVLQGERKELAKAKYTKAGDLEFTVPQKGEVVIRFINDRNGPNEVRYELRKL